MYINGLKYACSTCIKGHRSSHCSHVDRPLFEIRKKGRPVTQCTFCRDLRKTKQVHIKCACTDKKGIDATNNNPLLIYRNNSSCSPKSLNTTTTTTTSPVANDIMTMDICQDKKPNVAAANSDQCTCPSTNAALAVATTSAAAAAAPTSNAATSATFSNNAPMIKSSSTSSSSNLGFNQYQQPSNPQQEGTHSLLAPLCPTVPLVKDEENLSYSWALITSPLPNQMDMSAAAAAASSGLTNAASLISNATTTTAAMESNQLFSDMMMDTGDDQDTNNNTNNMHLGFIFHKPTSQRFLDGQPRVRRRRSNKQQQKPASTAATPTSANRLPVNALIDSSNLTINTITDYSLSTPPSSAVSPHPPSSSSNSSLAAACEPMDTHFDYLTEQLEILSNSSNNGNNNNNGQFMGDLANAEELTAILNNVFKEDELESVSTASHRSSVSTTATAPAMSSQANPHAMPTTMRSQCGSFVPRSTCCKPSSASNGESVVITITPLSTNNNTADKQQQADYPTTTRIVTCYCGNQCTCPGCLVHPGNFFLGSDPYAGPLIPSSNSSSCYGSDEEDLSATITASTFNNNNSNYNMPFS